MQTQALFDNIPQHIIAELNKATQSIVIAVAWFTRADIFAVLLQKARAGISIQLALSNDRINKNDKIAINQDELNHFENCQTYWIGDGNKELMHHKFCVIDNMTVITGSFNWSMRAEKNNFENITISQDTMLAKAFYQEFYKIIDKPIPTNEIVLPIAQIIKRLEILKNYVILEDLDDITRENQKLKQFESEQDISEIYHAIKKMQFSHAIGLIDNFIKKYHTIAIYADADIMALKLEIRLLEHELNAYDSEKAELEKLLADFNHQHSMNLGDLISEILSLRKQLAKQQGDQNAYDEAKQDEQTFNEQLDKEKAKTHYELNTDEQKRLKQAYRKASQICHPDRVNDEQKDMAMAVFNELRQAYEQNDLKTVERILDDLQKGIFKARSETVSQSDKLKLIKSQLSQKLDNLKLIIDEIKASQSYQVVSSIDDWQEYFDNQKMELMGQKDRLRELIKNTDVK
ncbi:phospholipase D-like domain-containing protein [Moraxella bovis]|uniref:phospholipase D n=1 Tax=Moraxella bovis TaxID=476 RepID=A0AAQ2T3K4_MORBO|nr:phospholipase D-like domain-containing protein [Moraxella bovis]UYZ76469.1 phospholipase D-like domain-containing protein [Moraxella bovis]UYZ77579.1 phospholipase D-like domain-containing protein [Moraxella bovis]UYZ81921.1 phospholipase D-like domain-containing protein [Moraxella bovis]UYZ86065.1 phospholipase D-like domain-containing protein [Moraxella bovis]UYZ88723.1 phospholipase D-like domain-containing protein [Moraxella bovis]